MSTINHPTSFETFTDHNGNPVQFQLTFLNLGDKFCVSADEITDSPTPRIFHSYDSEYQEAALTKVRKLIKDELNTLYFTANHKNPFDQLNGDTFRGHVFDNDDGEPIILVDGKEMTMEDFGEFLKPLVGFRIEVKLLD